MTSVHPFDPRARGTLCHAFIGAAVNAGIRVGQPAQLVACADSWEGLAGLPPTYRRVLKANIVQAASAYLANFLPCSCELVGAEVPVASTRADLVWRTSGGTVWLDEIKSGPSPLSRRREIERQTMRLLDAGSAVFEGFGGVRVCLLQRPSESWVLVPGGTGGPPVLRPPWR